MITPTVNENNKYTAMQKQSYQNAASIWNIHNLDPVVGSFIAHNNWEDYDTFLFKDFENLNTKSVLDFGCGPGRNLVKFSDRFARIDGVDISETNLKNAVTWIKHNNKDENKHKLILCNGVDLKNIQDEQYDIVMSTIAMQHICVYDIRYSYLKEFHRVLKPGGYITIQMGYGSPSPRTVDYYANNYDAVSTNRECDTEISHFSQVENDLIKIGFKSFNHYIRPTGPGDCHPAWIFFNAQK